MPRRVMMPLVVALVFGAGSGGCRSDSQPEAAGEAKPSASSTGSEAAEEGPPLPDRATLRWAALLVADITVDSARSDAHAEIAGAALKKVFAEGKGAVPWEANRPPSKGGLEARITFEYAVPPPGTALIAKAKATVPVESGGMTVRQFEAESTEERAVPEDAPPATEALREAFEQVASNLRRNVEAQLELLYGGDEAVLAALKDPDHPAFTEAENQASRRKLTGAIDHFVAKLDSEKRGDRIRGIDALGSIGSERALSPLARLTRSSQAVILDHAVRAMAKIGGQKSERYLNEIAKSHAYEPIRELAGCLLDDEGNLRPEDDCPSVY